MYICISTFYSCPKLKIHNMLMCPFLVYSLLLGIPKDWLAKPPNTLVHASPSGQQGLFQPFLEGSSEQSRVHASGCKGFFMGWLDKCRDSIFLRIFLQGSFKTAKQWDIVQILCETEGSLVMFIMLNLTPDN